MEPISRLMRGGKMLKLRPNCECCDKDLPADAADALICTFECTFCAECAANRLPGGRCPNCGGDLVRRPVRPPAMLAKYPASTERVLKPTRAALLNPSLSPLAGEGWCEGQLEASDSD
jgi:uncharacterized protein